MRAVNFKIDEAILWVVEQKAKAFYPTPQGGDKSKMFRHILERWVTGIQALREEFMPIYNPDGSVGRVVKVTYTGEAEIKSVEDI